MLKHNFLSFTYFSFSFENFLFSFNAIFHPLLFYSRLYHFISLHHQSNHHRLFYLFVPLLLQLTSSLETCPYLHLTFASGVLFVSFYQEKRKIFIIMNMFKCRQWYEMLRSHFTSTPCKATFCSTPYIISYLCR